MSPRRNRPATEWRTATVVVLVPAGTFAIDVEEELWRRIEDGADGEGKKIIVTAFRPEVRENTGGA